MTTAPAPARRVEYTPLDELPPALRNPKAHDQGAIEGSLDEFGMGELPLVDERTGRLVAGHGRRLALIALKAKGEPPPEGVQVADDGRWLVPVVRGWASRDDHHAEAYLLASNKLGERGGWDKQGLDEMLADLARADLELAQLTGFDDAYLDDLLEAGDDMPPPVIHEYVPATQAAYAETPEQEAAREQRVASQVPHAASGLVEMVLVYPQEDRAEVQRLVAAAREVLGADLKASEVVLRALRTLVAVLDERHRAEPVRMAMFALAAGAGDVSG